MSGGSDSAEDVVGALFGWDGAAGTAAELRARVVAYAKGQEKSSSGPARLRTDPPPGMRGLAKAADLYRAQQPQGLAAWLAKDRNAAEAPIFAPLLGDPALGPWPYARPLELSEPDTVAWAEVLARLSPPTDEAIRRFLGVAFQVRRRQTWPAACRAWAALARRDDELREQMRILWERCFGKLGDRWPKTGLGVAQGRARPGELGPNAAHLLRHTLFLGACWRTLGGDPAIAGLDPARLAGMPLPSDDADRSVVVLCLTELVPTALDAMASGIERRAAEFGGEELSEVAFRGLLGAIHTAGSEAGAEAVRAALIRPRWRTDATVRADGLWEWLETAAWFHARGDDAAVSAMAAGAAEAGDALAWRIGARLPASPVDELVARLGRLLDPDRFAIVPVRQRAALLAETRLLMRSEDVRPLAWPSLVRVAHPGAPDGGMRGTVEQVGEPSLCVLLAERALTSRTLMRDVVLEPANVLRIAGIQDGFVAGQVAVQAERILRETASPGPQVRFLWNLLQQDPPFRTFAELALVLRTEPPWAAASAEPSALHRIVAAVSALDQRRDEDAPIEVIAQAFAELVSCTRTLLALDAGPDGVGGGLVALARALVSAVEHPSDPLDDEAWFGRLEDVVLGSEVRGGLAGWAWWLESDDEAVLHRKRALTGRALGRLRAAVRMVRSARPAVTAEHHEELVAACQQLHDEVGPLGWPETQLVTSLLDRLISRSTDALAEGRRSAAAVKALDLVLERADEAALADLIRDVDQLRLLPLDQLRRIHRDLLGQLRFADAETLRRAVLDRIALPHRMVHVMPLFGAVAGGTFLVLDLADPWLALVGQREWAQYGATVVLALAASYGLLLNDLAPRLSTPGASRGQRWRILAVRALPTFLQAGAVSVIVSALVMATLGALTPTLAGVSSLGLWSALSLFLGVFIGLISQGQSATRSAADDR